MRMMQGRKKIQEIPLDRIQPNPSQPRRIFSSEDLEGLAASIHTNGLLQPLTVRRGMSGNYELIAGERRLRACRMLGMKTAPCIVSDCDDRQSAIFAMLENLQRQDLQLFEEAEGIQRLIAEWGVTQEEAAMRLGKSQSAIANKLRLLKLTPEERRRITEAGLTERHARALIRLSDEKVRGHALTEIIERGLNVQQTDELIDKILITVKKEKSSCKRTFVVKDVRIFINTINHAIDAMRQAGINARTEKRETEEYIECIVKIPKDAGRRSTAGKPA